MEFVECLPKELQDAYWLNEHIYFNIQSTEDAIYVIGKLNNYHRYFLPLIFAREPLRFTHRPAYGNLMEAATEEAKERFTLIIINWANFLMRSIKGMI